LNIIIFTITGVIGVNFFYQSVLKIPAKDDELPKFRKNVIRSWLVLYGFVGSQLGWTLRPFFGSPDEPFAIFRKIESNFYLHSLQVIGKILGFN
jgi:hypothetical protein